MEQYFKFTLADTATQYLHAIRNMNKFVQQENIVIDLNDCETLLKIYQDTFEGGLTYQRWCR